MCHPSHSIAAPAQSAVNSLSVGRSIREHRKRGRGYRERGGKGRKKKDTRRRNNKKEKILTKIRSRGWGRGLRCTRMKEKTDDAEVSSAGILKQSIGARNRVGRGLSLPYRPAKAT